MGLPNKEKAETILIVIEDLRRLFDEVGNNYQQMRNRVLGLIAGEVAMISFIFSGDGIVISELTQTEIVFFGFGSLFLGLSFAALLWIVSSSSWQVPLSINESKKLYTRFNSKLEWLEDIKADYEICIEDCLSKTIIRSKVFNKTIVMLSSGIIIMLVIKFTA